MSGQRNAEEIRTSSKLKLAFPSSRHRVSKKLQKLIPVINLPLRFNSSEKILTKILRVIALQRAHKRFLVKNKDTEESETSNDFLKVKSFSSVRLVHLLHAKPDHLCHLQYFEVFNNFDSIFCGRAILR